MLFLTVATVIYTQNFNKNESALILSADTSKMLRVIQVTNPEENKILNTVSEDIAFDDPLLPLLSRRMFASMRDTANPGIGIAAPQIGINRNVCWVQRFDKKNFPFEFYINPKIVWASELMRQGREGCLSIPDISGQVIRHYAIELMYQDFGGSIHREIIEGFTAVIFQHETDHLLGILFTERMETQSQAPYQDPSTVIKFLSKELPFR